MTHQPPRREERPSNRMPEGSHFYNRLVPLLLAGMGLLMVVLILIAAAIALGWIRF
jgi:hypothetical protein